MNNGVSFEGAVERWVVRRGATFTERRVRVGGAVAQHGHEVDVHAVFGSDGWKMTAPPAIAGLFAGILGAAIESVTIAVLGFAVFAVFLIVTGAIASERRHIWIECKSGDGTVRRDVIWKLASQVADVRASAPDWYPVETWLVVRSRLDVDTIQFARSHGVRCFVEQSGDIREVI